MRTSIFSFYIIYRNDGRILQDILQDAGILNLRGAVGTEVLTNCHLVVDNLELVVGTYGESVESCLLDNTTVVVVAYREEGIAILATTTE